MTHIIRLRHPWECTPNEHGWCFTRRFQAPTGLTNRDHLFLEVRSLAVEGMIRLNGQELGAIVQHMHQRFPLQDLRTAGNQIELWVSAPTELSTEDRTIPGELFSEVCLAIESIENS